MAIKTIWWVSIDFYWLVEPINNNQWIIIDYHWLYWLQSMIDFHWLISPISVRNSHQNSKRRRKTNVDSRFLMNKIICSIFTLQVANIGIDIILASFKFSNNCDFFLIFWKHTWPRCCAHEAWSLQRQEFVVRRFLLRGKKAKKSEPTQSFFRILVISSSCLL